MLRTLACLTSWEPQGSGTVCISELQKQVFHTGGSYMVCCQLSMIFYWSKQVYLISREGDIDLPFDVREVKVTL